jgi:DNA-binding GntR family transcriptional regulator
MILNRKLVGGELLVEGRLATLLNLTRTPLREALVRLEGEGLLVKQANRSFSVHIVGASEFFQSMKVRQHLEAEAVALAAGRVDPEAIEALRARVVEVLDKGVQGPDQWTVDEALHTLIAQASGNAVLAKMIQKLRITTLLFEVSRPFGRAGADAEEHLEILQAVQDGDTKVARRAMVDHLKNIEQDVLEIVSGG